MSVGEQSCVPEECRKLDYVLVVDCRECKLPVCSWHCHEMRHQTDFSTKLCSACFFSALQPFGFDKFEATMQMTGMMVLASFAFVNVAALSSPDNWCPSILAGVLCAASIGCLFYVNVLKERSAIVQWTVQQRQRASKDD